MNTYTNRRGFLAWTSLLALTGQRVVCGKATAHQSEAAGELPPRIVSTCIHDRLRLSPSLIRPLCQGLIRYGQRSPSSVLSRHPAKDGDPAPGCGFGGGYAPLELPEERQISLASLHPEYQEVSPHFPLRSSPKFSLLDALIRVRCGTFGHASAASKNPSVRSVMLIALKPDLPEDLLPHPRRSGTGEWSVERLVDVLNHSTWWLDEPSIELHIANFSALSPQTIFDTVQLPAAIRRKVQWVDVSSGRQLANYARECAITA